MIKKLVYLTIPFSVVLALGGCDPTNPAQEIPSYISIDTISFEVLDPEHGTANQKISDAWVYVNDNLIGAFELPTTLPVLADGTQKVKVVGGIKINGISATRTFYPYFSGWTKHVDLKPKETIKINPVETYKPTTTFVYTTDFESELSLVSLPYSTIEPQLITSTNVLVPELNGTACAGFYLEKDSSFFSVRQKTDTSFFLPTGGRLVFLEMNYKNNQPFFVGITASNPSGDEAFRVLTVNPSEKWNKLYVNLTSVVSENFQAKGYNIWFYGQKKAGITKGEVFLDNIKLLY